MAAVPAISFCVHLRDNNLHARKILQPKIGLGENGHDCGNMATNLRWRCGSAGVSPDPVCKSSTAALSWSRSPARSSFNKYALGDELLEGAGEPTSLADIEPPPSYYDTVRDNPPQYTFNDSLFNATLSEHTLSQPLEFVDPTSKALKVLLSHTMAPGLDFCDSSNFRQVGAKKKKGGQKPAWQEQDNEGNKEAGREDENGGGDGGGDEGGGGNNGNGGAGDGGDGGGGDDWNAGKKKKGKKNKGGVDDEEEKRKREEEEERVRKEEEEAENAGGGDLSWADGDANPDDEWGGYTKTEKKGKKNKKGKTDPINGPSPVTNPPYSSNFDSIDLDDTPKLNLDFGSGSGSGPATKETNSASGFNFSGWGSSWDTKHDSNSGDAGTTDITDITKNTMPGETSLWSFDGNTKSKKKTASHDFGYGDFSTFKDTHEEPGAFEDNKVGGNDEWQGASGFGKKDKKNKKKDVFSFEDKPDPEPQPAIGASIAEQGNPAEESWGGDGWGATTTKHAKKNGKKGEVEPNPSGPPSISPPPPATLTAHPVEDSWGSFGAKKEKKKGKKNVVEEVEKLEEPSIMDVQESEPTPDLGWGVNSTTDEWGAFGTKKEKKKGKKNAIEEVEESSTIDVAETKPAAALGWGVNSTTDEWGAFGTKKEKKKGKKNAIEEEVEEPSTMDVAESKPAADLGWGVSSTTEEWGTFGAKKEKKKGKKNAIEEVEEPSTMDVAESKPAAELGWGVNSTTEEWGTFGAKKEKKKGKRNAIEDFEAPSIINVPEQEPEPEPIADTGWGVNEKKDKKKNRKGVVEETAKFDEFPSSVVPEFEPAAEVSWGPAAKKAPKKNRKMLEELDKVKDQEAIITESKPEADASWGVASSKNEKKKPKKGFPEDFEHKEDPVDPVVTMPGGDAWGSESKGFETKKQKKKTKKGVAEESETVEDPVFADFADPDSKPRWGFEAKKEKETFKKADFEGFENEDDPGFPTVAEPAGWGFGNKSDKKKSKKGFFDGPDPIEEIVEEAVHEPEATVDTGWGSLTNKGNKKKGKKTALEDTKLGFSPNLVDVPEQTPVIESAFDAWSPSAKKDKKNKKGLPPEVIEDSIVVSEIAAATEATTTIGNDNWMDWAGDKRKDKKGKKGPPTDAKKEEFLPSPPPPVIPDIPDPSSFDLWEAPKKEKEKEKEKKGKKGKAIEPEPVSIVVPELAVDKNANLVEPEWGNWGLSAKDKRKKEKEREKEEQEKREQEEQESAEKEKEKLGKRGKTTGASGISKTKDLMAEFTPDPIPTIEGETWGSWGGPKKGGKKSGKKDVNYEAPPPAPTPPAQGLTPEPTPSPIPGLDYMDEDDWEDPAPTEPKAKKDVKKLAKGEDWKGNKKPVQGKAGEKIVDAPKDKFRGAQTEETAAKAARNFWGGTGSTVTASSKPKAAKEKDMASEEANDLIDFGIEDADLVDDMVDEPAAKWTKSKADSKVSKVSKVSAKESDKSSKLSDKKKKGTANNANNGSANANDMAEMMMTESDFKIPGGGNWNGNGNGNGNEISAADEEPKDDAWSFWGTAKKPSGKKEKEKEKEAEKMDEPKREIAKQSWTNQMPSLNPFSNQPEAPAMDDQPELQNNKNLKTTMPSAKPPKSSVAQRVKALEKERLEKEKEKEREREREKQKALQPIESPPFEDFEPLAKFDSPPKKSSAFGKAKVTATSKNSPPKKKDPSPPAGQDKQLIQDLLPGSFPAEGADDDIVDVIAPIPVEKKTNKKPQKSKKEPRMDFMDFNMPTPAAPEVPEVPDAPPTPPPEPVAAKPVKKERARVVRDEGASSWGFWTASPKKTVKKDVKAKDDADVAPVAKERAAPTGLVRSKSTKIAKEKEVEKSSAKSSGSDKDKKLESRPSKSRGTGFGVLFGGPPPARSKTVRRPSAATSKNTSRRQSFDANAIGLASPPAEVIPEMSSKAAKLMGTSPVKVAKKTSTQGKQKAAAVPDPYPIDDDDLVMVNGLEDPIINAPIPKNNDVRRDKSTKTKAKKEVKPAPDLLDDIVMVEAGPSSEGAELPSLQEALAFAEPPRPPPALQRSATSARKSDNKLMGLFGGFRKTRRASETYERPRTKSFAADDGNLRRKRPVASGRDDTKRIRRDDRKVRRSDRPEPATDGFVTDVPMDGEVAGAEDAEDRRREDRRATRPSQSRTKDSREPRFRDEVDQKIQRQEYDQAQDDTRRASHRDSKDRRARREDEEAVIRKEERRAKRATRDERSAKQEPLSREPDFIPTSERRSKRRDKDPVDRELPPESSSRPRKPDRHHSHNDTPLSPGAAERRPRRDERRSSHRAPDEKSSRHRKPSAMPVDDYFDPRNGTANEIPENPPLEPQDPYIHNGAKDQTSSWVQSQISEPAPPPPLEPSVLDPAPVLGGGAGGVGASGSAGAGAGDESTHDEDARRAMRRKSRRQSTKYADHPADQQQPDADPDADRRRRRDSRRRGEGNVRSSEGSDERDRDRDRAYYRRRSDFGGVSLAAGGGGGGRGFGTGGAGRRGSWFQKFKGLADPR